jgi:hypothetical protein
MKKAFVLALVFLFSAATAAFALTPPKGTGLVIEGGGGGFTSEFKVIETAGHSVTVSVPTHPRQIEEESITIGNLKLHASIAYFDESQDKWILIPEEYEDYALTTMVRDGNLIAVINFPEGKGNGWYSPRIWIDDVSTPDKWGWIDQSSPNNRYNLAKKPSYEFVYHARPKKWFVQLICQQGTNFNPRMRSRIRVFYLSGKNLNYIFT